MNKLNSQVRIAFGDPYFVDLVNKNSCDVEDLRLRLLERQTKRLTFNANDVPDREKIKKKWVANASSIDLKGSEVQLLRKGLNYPLTPDALPRKEIIASVEQSITILLAAAIEEIGVEMSYILKALSLPE